VYDTNLMPGKDIAMNRPPAMFVADALGLDFLNSLATPVDAPVDWIPDGEGLLLWLEQAHLVPPAALKAMRAGANARELDAVAAEARSLREWFRGFVRKHHGRPLGPGDLGELGRLNKLLERDDSYLRLAAPAPDEDGPLALQRQRRWDSPHSLLLPIAEILARLVATEDFTHVKACEGPVCTMYFADHTRGHARRWCSMALCGNRAKQAAHRERLKAQRRGLR
jgi:predicted RNA-binding Zn ribbon-like protein